MFHCIKLKIIECKNYRNIILIGVFGKIYGEVSLDRIHITTEGHIDDAQDGFRPEMVGGISSLL